MTTAHETTACWRTVDSPLGQLLLTADAEGRLTSVLAPRTKHQPEGPDPRWREDPDGCAGLNAAADQLTAYFAGEREEFELALAPVGSAFQREVWAGLDAIPYGETVTYGELAAACGKPPASVRAVAAAVGRNPLLIIRPCHRVLGANGSLTGFAAGLDAKRLLLDLEAPALFA